jgi:hypothetical protein
MNIFFIAGNWSHNGGQSSSFAVSLTKSLMRKLEVQTRENFYFYNGGNTESLQEICSNIQNNDILLWGIENNDTILRDIQEKNPDVTVILYQHCSANEYSPEEMLQIIENANVEALLATNLNEKRWYNMKFIDRNGNLLFNDVDLSVVSDLLANELQYNAAGTYRKIAQDA